jgi:hypothetical protein
MTEHPRNHKWYWLWLNSEKKERLRQVGILADGSLWNPNNYPEDVVRAACLAELADRHERRSRAAKEAAQTRGKRKQLRVWGTAKRIAAKQQTGPRQHCYVCGRHLTDAESITRGIGSECWQQVLEQVGSILTTAGAP